LPGIAEDGIGYEYVTASPANGAKKPFKIISGLISAQWDACPICT
jgi:hypothetical protein